MNTEEGGQAREVGRGDRVYRETNGRPCTLRQRVGSDALCRMAAARREERACQWPEEGETAREREGGQEGPQPSANRVRIKALSDDASSPDDVPALPLARRGDRMRKPDCVLRLNARVFFDAMCVTRYGSPVHFRPRGYF